ncbi:MAG: hypothetical protein QNJ46_19220 [Leptolyngbyaceae cyanobacterium MO_188.B28]|nr:hypothetical protein [Leptolyngbyaceae cyanobacterium MO_188.B28]
MQRTVLCALLCCLLLFLVPIAPAQAQADNMTKIQSAMSAAPLSIADNATVADWPGEPDGDMPILREGDNDWTCLPDMPDTPGNDPMCLDQPWLEWLDAWVNEKETNIAQMGFGYMLQEGSPESNTDPYAEGPTSDNEWITEGTPHLMILAPDAQMLAGLPTDPENGGPWVMWRDTSYVHIMAPMPKYQPE